MNRLIMPLLGLKALMGFAVAGDVVALTLTPRQMALLEFHTGPD